MGIWVSYWVWSLKSMRLLTSYCLKWKICVFSQNWPKYPEPISTLKEHAAVAFIDHFFRSLPPNSGTKLWHNVFMCSAREKDEVWKDDLDYSCRGQGDCALCMFVRWAKPQLQQQQMGVYCMSIITKHVDYFWYILGHSPNNVHFPFVQEKSCLSFMHLAMWHFLWRFLVHLVYGTRQKLSDL